jgi:glycosyltransferase involved in cell wall biosynthesis
MSLRVLLTLHQGGAMGSVNSVLHLGLGLARRGVAVRLVCPPQSAVEQAAREGGLEVRPLGWNGSGRFRNARALAELLAREPVDLINSQSSRDRQALTWLALCRGGRLPAPVVFTRRSYPRTFWLENWLTARVATRIIAVSEPVATALAAGGVPPSRLAVVPNGVLADAIDVAVAPEAVARWRERIGWDGYRRVVAIVARPKDQTVAVRALDQVETPVRLVMPGLGTVPAGLRWPDRHAVVALPFEPDVRPLYELVDLALHPSRWDAMPQAVLEAMALGKPVIASRATGNAFIIRDEVDGLLVAPTDPVAWGRAIDRVLGDPGLATRLAAAGRRRAREDFPLSRTVEGTLHVYQEVLAEWRGPGGGRGGG